jgi:cytoskeletal protein CcmA (bactofilin family)
MHLVSCLRCIFAAGEIATPAGSRRRANPLSANSKNDRPPKARTDTVIGVGLRLNGNISCTGVLRIEGEVHGDVSCDADSGGTIVIAGSGTVCGAIRAPHVIVAGAVVGPLDSSGSIDIQQGGNVAGDILYRAIHIHPGGVIDGALIAGDRSERVADVHQGGRRTPLPVARSEADAALVAASGGNARRSPRPVLRIATAAALFAVIVAVVLLNRSPESPPSPAAEAAGNAGPASDPATVAPGATADAAPRQDGPGAGGGAAPPAAPATDASTSKPAPEPAPQVPAAESERLVSVHGVNPGKPGGVFSVVSKEPSVLMRKQRDEASEGTRIELPQGAAVSISFARNEIFRVAQGRNMEIFYQGRKVGPKTIESGAWMSFVPQSSPGAPDRK